MKLGAFIEALKQFDPDLIVTLADWNEAYEQDNEEAAESIKIRDWEYSDKNGFKSEGRHLVIGCDND